MTTGDARREPLTLSVSRTVANSIFGARKFTDRFVRELASRTHDKQILEIGSGKATDGIYLKSYQDYFIRSNVFTRSDVNPGYGHRIIDVTSMGHEDDFDLILCINVLEHVFQLGEAARNLYRAARKSGCVAVVVPALYPLHDEPHDYWRMTEHSLRRLFRDFERVEIRNSGLRKLPFMYSAVATK